MSTNSQKVVLNNVNVYFATNLAVLEARLKCKNKTKTRATKTKPQVQDQDFHLPDYKIKKRVKAALSISGHLRY